MSEELKQIGARGNPVLIFTIANGAGHIRVAQGIAEAIRALQRSVPVSVIDVADHMTALTRFTHVSAFLWLVKHAPAVWDRVDRFQKGRNHTSPEWYYRRGCHRLFEFTRRVRPCALVATEVGCCEIAALIKRDLKLSVPLVAVNNDRDVDRAWVQPEVDLYCFVTNEQGEQLLAHGAPSARLAIWGAPLPAGYDIPRDHEKERAELCRWLRLDPGLPLLLIAGGADGMGQIEKIAEHLLRLNQPKAQLIVLTGRNKRLRSRCERIALNGQSLSCRVRGWVGPEQMPKLMWGADLMISKLGSMFNEAVASELPIVAMEPPPGAERIQYELLREWKIGSAVRTVDEVIDEVGHLLSQPELLAQMRRRARARRTPGVSGRIASWLIEAIYEQQQATRRISTGRRESESLAAVAQSLSK